MPVKAVPGDRQAIQAVPESIVQASEDAGMKTRKPVPAYSSQISAAMRPVTPSRR